MSLRRDGQAKLAGVRGLQVLMLGIHADGSIVVRSRARLPVASRAQPRVIVAGVPVDELGAVECGQTRLWVCLSIHDGSASATDARRSSRPDRGLVLVAPSGRRQRNIELGVITNESCIVRFANVAFSGWQYNLGTWRVGGCRAAR
jgi:hypothetical protein